MTTTNDTATHITDVDAATVAVGDLVEQGGATYRIVNVAGITNGMGFTAHAIYYVWTDSDESDTFRSVVNSRGAVGQIRWEAPHGMAVWFNGSKVTA